ncbi:Histone RNA hairpin-binding protein [Lamellibrachia satsuma]|nr:Histone RNA hairpin-binding protein [Lamellibrachia satsuma]
MLSHRSLNENYNHREEGGRRRNNVFTPKRENRYQRQGALSPLRSPLRDQVYPSDGPQRRTEGSHHRDDRRSRSKRGVHRLRGGQQNRSLFPRNAYDNENWHNKEITPPFKDDEFPALDNIRYTPENPRSRMSRLPLSKPGDWATQVEQYELQEVVAVNDLRRFKRKLSLTESVISDNSERNGTDKSLLEIEENKDVLIRRQKQIDYGRGLEAYRRYLMDVPRHLRTDKHPHTPKKFRKYSRRSWDMQIRIWKRQLHLWEHPDSSVPDDASSTASAVPDDACSSASASDGLSTSFDPCDMESVDSSILSNSQDNPNELAENLKSVVLDTDHMVAPQEVDDTAVVINDDMALVIDADIGDDELLDW